MKQKIYTSLFFLIVCSITLNAQDKTKVVKPFESNWVIPEGVKVKFETFEERETILLNGRIFTKNENFSNGIIEVDVFANQKRSFAGIIFRNQEGTREEAYMRMHKSKQPDAVQYTPTYNGESAWQLYSEHQVNVVFKKEGWNTLRIETIGQKASIFVNDKKVHTVHKLKTGNIDGQLGLFSLFENRFSNFKFTKTDSIKIEQKSKNSSKDPNIIKNWAITQATLYTEENFDPKGLSDEKKIFAYTEDSGLLPISKYIEKSVSGNFEGNPEVYTIASIEIKADKEDKKLFSFDYSDKIIVYLNGQPIFFGNNAFRSKGIQFKGHLNINANRLHLNLNKGKNVLECVVIDRANGWGLMGKLE